MKKVVRLMSDYNNVVVSALIFTLGFSVSAQIKVFEFKGGHLTVEASNRWISSESDRTLMLSQKGIPETLQITYVYDSKANLEEVYSTYISESLPKEFKGFNIIEEDDLLINGRKFKSILFNTNQYGSKYQTIIYLTMNNDLGYAFIGTSTPIRMNRISSEFYDIVGSVKFLSPTSKTIIKDEKLKQLYGKKWVLSTQDYGFGHLPASLSDDSSIYFELEESSIHQAKLDDSDSCLVPFEYDNSTNTITFFCKGRNLSKQILKVSSTNLTMKEIDEVGETIERIYTAEK